MNEVLFVSLLLVGMCVYQQTQIIKLNNIISDTLETLIKFSEAITDTHKVIEERLNNLEKDELQ